MERLQATLGSFRFSVYGQAHLKRRCRWLATAVVSNADARKVGSRFCCRSISLLIRLV
jgi:hypothetical protein